MADSDANDAAGLIVTKYLIELADFISIPFPHHAVALKTEIIGAKLTESKWQRIAGVLASLHCLPGVELTLEEHDKRNLAQASVLVAQKMATASFIDRNPKWCIEIALWYTEELNARITNSNLSFNKNNKQGNKNV